MSHLSPNELESLVQEAHEATGAGYVAMAGGEIAPASKPAQEQPNAKCAKCAFAEDVEMPQAVSESYEKWAQWRDHVAATFHAFIGDDLATKKVREYHVELMHRGLDQAGVDMATEWAAPSSEPHEALLMMALYENHALALGRGRGGMAPHEPPGHGPCPECGGWEADRGSPSVATH